MFPQKITYTVSAETISAAHFIKSFFEGLFLFFMRSDKILTVRTEKKVTSAHTADRTSDAVIFCELTQCMANDIIKAKSTGVLTSPVITPHTNAAIIRNGNARTVPDCGRYAQIPANKTKVPASSRTIPLLSIFFIAGLLF